MRYDRYHYPASEVRSRSSRKPRSRRGKPLLSAVPRHPYAREGSGPGSNHGAGVTLEEAVARARFLGPAPEGARPHAEELRRCPDESVRELNDSGLMRLLQHGVWADRVRLGGDDRRELRACARLRPTAWNWANWRCTLDVALWPRQCQDEV